MIDFESLPKQWLIGCAPVVAELGTPAHAKRAEFRDMAVLAAPEVPVVTLRQGAAPLGLLVGWPIHERTLYRRDAVLDLDPAQTPEEVFAGLGGRFVMLWSAAEGGRFLREDSSGSMPAVYSPGAGLTGSTTTVISAAVAHETDGEIEAIFDFPARRGAAFFPSA